MPRVLSCRASSQLAWALTAVGVLFVVGVGWGLPASDPWDNDGVAPRDFLVAVAQTFAKDHFDFAYLHLAPFHLLLLTVLTLPVTVPTLASVPALNRDALIDAFIQTKTATPIAWIARFVSVLMALGVVYHFAKIGEELRGRRAAPIVAAACGANAALAYYAHVTNLEVPYLFWGSGAILALVRAVARREPRRLRVFAVMGALAIGSKDQAAGLFLLSAPAVLVAWVLRDDWARQHRRTVAREAVGSLVIALALFLLADEVVLNPTGFAARVRFLFGPASHDWAEYARDGPGSLALLRDIVAHTTRSYPAVFVLLAALGIALGAVPHPSVAGHEAPARPRLYYFVPLACALSFTVCVNLNASRTEDRFILPQTLVVGLYAGLALDALLDVPRRIAGGRGRRGAAAFAACATIGLLAWAALKAASVDATLLYDPRFDTEAWMCAHVAPGDSIEVYGRNVYNPRFPASAKVTRVDPGPVVGRSPVPGLVEVQARWDDLPNRRPKWISVSNAWAWRYLEDPVWDLGRGRHVAQARLIGVDPETCGYFRALVAGQLGYRVMHTSAWTSTFWPAVHVHASTGETVWTLERID